MEISASQTSENMHQRIKNHSNSIIRTNEQDWKLEYNKARSICRHTLYYPNHKASTHYSKNNMIFDIESVSEMLT